MTRETFMSARSKREEPGSSARKPQVAFKDLIERTSGLMGTRDVAKVCNFITNPQNNNTERVQLIHSLGNTMLLPHTYDELQGTLSKLSREDSDTTVKVASTEIFNLQRNKTTSRFKEAV